MYKEIYVTRPEKVVIFLTQGTNALDLQFRVMDWDIPSGAVANIYLLKPSGHQIYNAGTVSDNLITFPLTTQMTAEAGYTKGQIRIVESQSILNSFPVTIFIDETFIDDAAVESTDEFTALEAAIAAAGNIEQAREDAAEALLLADQLEHTKVSLANVEAVGSEVLPGYFDNEGVFKTITGLKLNDVTIRDYNDLRNILGFYNKGANNTPIYGNSNGTLTPITQPIPETLGGTGMNSLDRIFKYVGSATAASVVNADNAPVNSIVHFTDTEAGATSNMPVSVRGNLLTFTGSTGNQTQVYSPDWTGSTRIYLRRSQSGTWGSWWILNAEELTPSWNPVVIESGGNLNYGGYYISGSWVYVQMRMTMTQALAANTALNLTTSMPPCRFTSIPLTVTVNNRGGHAARVTNNGILTLIADVDHGISSGQTVEIAGMYAYTPIT